MTNRPMGGLVSTLWHSHFTGRIRVGFRRREAPRVACSTSTIYKYHLNPLKFIKIHRNHWESMEILVFHVFPWEITSGQAARTASGSCLSGTWRPFACPNWFSITWVPENDWGVAQPSITHSLCPICGFVNKNDTFGYIKKRQDYIMSRLPGVGLRCQTRCRDLS